jgi:hypothetical protein
MTRTKKQSTEAAVREIRRRTRRKFSPPPVQSTSYVTPTVAADRSLVVFRVDHCAASGARGWTPTGGPFTPREQAHRLTNWGLLEAPHACARAQRIR